MQIISKLKEVFTVLKVTRNGSDRNTTYDIEGNNRSLEPTTMTGEHPAAGLISIATISYYREREYQSNAVGSFSFKLFIFIISFLLSIG